MQVFLLGDQMYNRNMEKVCIFIDSGNFYHLVLKKLGLKEINFDFEKFSKFLAGEREIAKEGKRFYVATVREKAGWHENQTAMSNQTTFFSGLINIGNWKIETSKLRTRREKIKIDDRVEGFQGLLKLGIKEIIYERSREKGVDVKLAIDLVIEAIDGRYDTAILVSSDTDIVPAVDLVRSRLKKKVEYIGFSIPESDTYEATKPVKRMIYSTDTQRVLSDLDIKSFIVKNLFVKELGRD